MLFQGIFIGSFGGELPFYKTGLARPGPAATPSAAKSSGSATGLKQDIVALVTSFFGDKTAELIKTMYDEEHPEELIGAAEDMLSKLLGPENAKKQLQALYAKYAALLKRGK